MIGGWRKWHEEIYYSTPHKIISATKSRRMREAGNMARRRYNETHTEFWLGNLKERDHFEDPGADIRVT